MKSFVAAKAQTTFLASTWKYMHSMQNFDCKTFHVNRTSKSCVQKIHLESYPKKLDWPKNWLFTKNPQFRYQTDILAN